MPSIEERVANLEQRIVVSLPIDATSQSVLRRFLYRHYSTTENLGVVTLSTAPLSQVLPIVVGTNDTRISVYAADSEASDTYVITASPALTAYTTGQIISFKANTANTGAATLNVNSLGAKTILKHNDQTLATGDIESGQIITVIYD